MSSTQENPTPISQKHSPQNLDTRRDSTDPDVVHHLYFEDNDSFFPPTWLGQEESSQRRFSTDSTTSQQSKIEANHERTWQPPHSEGSSIST